MTRTLHTIALIVLAELAVGCVSPGGFFGRRQVQNPEIHVGAAQDAPSRSGDMEVARSVSSSKLPRYARARSRDFLDVPTIRVGVTGLARGLVNIVPGLAPRSKITPLDLYIGMIFVPIILIPHVDVQATSLAHVGAGLGLGTVTWGIGRGTNGRVESHIGFPFSNFIAVRDYGGRGLAVCHVCDLEYENDHTCALVPLLFTARDDGTFGPPRDEPDYPPIRWADVEVGASAILMTVRLGVSPGEMLDFAAGWFGLDPAGDDGKSRPGDETGHPQIRSTGERGS